MVIDLILIALLLLAGVKGYKRGLIVGVFSFVAVVVGLAAAVKLSVVAADAVAETVREVLCVQEIHEQVQPNGPRHRIWKHLQQRLGSMEPEAAERQGNLLAALFAAGRLQAVADVDVVLERYQSTRQELLGSMPSGVKAEVAA